MNLSLKKRMLVAFCYILLGMVSMLGMLSMVPLALQAGPLHEAIKNKEQARTMRLVDGGADINEKDEIGGLPIFYAIALGEEKIVTYLIGKGVDLKSRAFTEELTVLEYACSFRNLKIIRSLLEAGANLYTGSYTPLYLASERGFTDVVKFLLEKKVKVNGRKNYVPMVAASYNGHGDVMRLLLENGVRVSKKYKKGMNALMIASQRGRRYAMAIAIKYGSKLEAKNTAGKTALHLAIEARQFYAIRLLLDKGASVTTKDRKQEDALQKAKKTGIKKLIRLVKKYAVS